MTLLAAPLALAAGDSADPDRGPLATAKKKCRATQVAVRVGKRTRICQPRARFFPRPRAGDSRRVGVEAVLGLDLGRVGRRRVPSLQSVLGRRRATTVRRKLLVLLPKLIRRVDAGTGARASANLDDCGATGPGFNENTNGGSIGASNGTGQMTAPAGGGFRVRVTFPVANCDKFEAAACPTAEGVVEGKAEVPRDIHLLIYDSDELVLNQSYRTTERATFKGQVADDAKLAHLDIDDAVAYHFSSGGSAVGPHLLIDATIARSVRVNMRANPPSYQPTQAQVRVLMRVNGRSAGAEEDLRTAADLASRFARDFSSLVDRAVRMYRAQESHWNDPNKCAQMEFSPASESLTLSRDQTGSVSATVKAADGASPSVAKWTASNQQNGSFSPLQSDANPFSVSYTVTNAGAGIKVSADFRATSKAGVAQKTWSQRTTGVPEHINGSWHRTVHHGGLTWNISFSASFDRVASTTASIKGEYDMVSGSGSWNVSGQDPDTLCNKTGSGTFDAANGGAILQTPGNATPGPPFDYLIQTAASDDAATYSYTSCPDPNDDGSVQGFAPFSGLNISSNSPDGIAFNGSAHEEDFESTTDDTWTFTGTP